MNELAQIVGTVVAAFFILSLAVETILENFRGVLLLFGIETLKSKKTLEEGLAEAAEFVPDDSKEYARFAAFVNLVQNELVKGNKKSAELETIAFNIAAAVTPVDKDALIQKVKTQVATIAAPVKATMQVTEERRVLALRLISAAVGIVVAYFAGLNVLDLASKTPADPYSWRAYGGYALAGLAAAGGSSFWHDQLDRIRSIKQIGQQLVTIIPTKASAPGGGG